MILHVSRRMAQFGEATSMSCHNVICDLYHYDMPAIVVYFLFLIYEYQTLVISELFVDTFTCRCYQLFEFPFMSFTINQADCNYHRLLLRVMSNIILSIS